MKSTLAPLVTATLLLGAVGPARAEHTAGALQPSVELKLGFRAGPDGFTLESRGNGPSGPWDLWLDGRLRPGGFSLDGRLRDGERGYDLRLDGSLSGESPGR
jgi:hypothetical protein